MLALLLTMLMAWGGHAAAWLKNVSQPAATSHALQHAHLYEHDAQIDSACVLCQLQHDHAPLDADHLHETPYPTVLIKVQALAEHGQMPSTARHRIPEDPVFLIERPPRPQFVL
ncbi:hypothetical protein [Pseudomonas linyingensis]|uniref:hypothetical protein n=1 Tax=Pseudomonas linyingensis TaxID=915471 RepID=UPI0011143F1F|nr:hypothetical protein [Pseudomonas linyingensis]